VAVGWGRREARERVAMAAALARTIRDATAAERAAARADD